MIKNYFINGKRFYRVDVKVRDKSGTQISRSRKGIPNERRAQEVQFEFKKELESLVNTSNSSDWRAWLNECLSRMKLTCAPSTVINYRGGLEKWANPILGEKKLSDITRNDVYHIVFEYLDASFTMNYRKHILKKIKRILQMAVEEGLIDRNPAIGIKVRVPEVEQKVLTTDEVKIFLNQARILEHPFYPIWVSALSTGMRSGELFALMWTDIDFDSQLISVSRQWTSKGGFCPTKSRKSRIVPVSNDFLTFLKEYKLKADVDSVYVLPHLQEWKHGEAARVTKRFCKSIGITPIKFHDLRATFITNLLSRGVSLAKVMSIVGHSEIKTTNVYLRKAGIEVKGATEDLGYKIPTGEIAEVIPLFADELGN